MAHCSYPDPLGNDPFGEDAVDDPLDVCMDEESFGEDSASEDPLGEDPIGEDPTGEDPTEEDPDNESPDGDAPSDDPASSPAGEKQQGKTPRDNLLAEDDDLSDFLEGRLLVAMPGMGDPRFERSVIFMCAHSDEGAMGLIINQPAHELKFEDLLSQLDIKAGKDSNQIIVHIGGPVEHGRGFVLHSTDYCLKDGTMKVTDAFGMTATLEVLQDIAEGNGPDESLLVLGYAGWGPGQLEDELRAHGWVTCDADKSIIFDVDDAGKWAAAISSIGIDPMMLSGSGGRA